MKAFTGIKDLDREILIRTEFDKDLLNACIANKYVVGICDENFFRRRLAYKYPNSINYKPKNMGWKKYYLSVVYYADKLKQEFGFEVSRDTQNPRKYYELLKNDNGQFILEQAARYGWVDLVKFLVKFPVKDEDLDYNDAIIMASLGKNFENALIIVKYLIDFIPDIGIFELNLALANSIMEGNTNLMDYLISKGANNWNLALKSAVYLGDRKLINYFIEKGANDWNLAILGAARAGREDLVFEFLHKSENINEMDWNEALFNAAISGSKDLIEYFILQGANNWNKGMYGATIGNHVELVKSFIRLGAGNWYGARNYTTEGSYLYDFFTEKINKLPTVI
jgi:hypothetical protein